MQCLARIGAIVVWEADLGRLWGASRNARYQRQRVRSEDWQNLHRYDAPQVSCGVRKRHRGQDW